MSNIITPETWTVGDRKTKDSDGEGGSVTNAGAGVQASPSGFGVSVWAARTGGQGKTLGAQAQARALARSGVVAVLAAADSARAETKSKFGALFEGVRELGIGASLDDAVKDGELVARHWDSVGDILEAPAAVLDVGANVIGALLSWGRIVGAEAFAGSNLTLIVPVTAQRQAIEDAIEVIDDAKQAGGLSFRRIIVAFNEVRGDPAKVPGADILAARASVMRIPAGPVGILEWLEQGHHPLSYFDGCGRSKEATEAIAKEMGVNRYQAAREMGAIDRWLAAVDAELSRLKLDGRR